MKRLGLAALAATLGIVVAASPAVSSGQPVHAQIAKKCKKKHGKKRKCKKAAPPPAVTPTPLALTEAEVIDRVVLQAGAYCAADAECTSSGYYWDSGPGTARCSSKTTYSWTCDGWKNDLVNPEPAIFSRCDFREVVERDGYNGIKSHQDTSFGSGGWDCYSVF